MANSTSTCFSPSAPQVAIPGQLLPGCSWGGGGGTNTQQLHLVLLIQIGLWPSQTSIIRTQAGACFRL
jgi:hypothetical protein